MEYEDEKIAELKKELRRQKYTHIKGEGIFINRQFTKFCLRAINDDVGLYIPEEFIDMPEEIQLMKFPSVNRPQRIFTSLDGSVNFAFSIVDYQIPDTQIESLAEQMEEVIRKSNPAAIFYQDDQSTLVSGRTICMFDFKNYGIDEQMYNMLCFTSLNHGTLHGTFICLDRDADDWKEAAWEAFKTITEIKPDA